MIEVKSGSALGFLPEASKDYIEALGVRFVPLEEDLGEATSRIYWDDGNTNRTLKLFLDMMTEGGDA